MHLPDGSEWRDLLPLFLKFDKIRPLFVYFRFVSRDKYSTKLTINDKRIDGVLGTQTQGSRMVDADEPTELRQCYKAIMALIKIIQWGLNKSFTGRSPGLVVMGGDSYSKCCGFKSMCHIPDGHFFQL